MALPPQRPEPQYAALIYWGVGGIGEVVLPAKEIRLKFAWSRTLVMEGLGFPQIQLNAMRGFSFGVSYCIVSLLLVRFLMWC